MKRDQVGRGWAIIGLFGRFQVKDVEKKKQGV